MKCPYCGNEIPDTSTKCPYCNNKVTPLKEAIPVYNVSNANNNVNESIKIMPSNNVTNNNLNNSNNTNNTNINSVNATNTNSIPVPPTPPVSPVPPAPPKYSDNIGSNQANVISYIDTNKPTTLNLNSNANADIGKKIGETADNLKDKKVKKKRKKLIIAIVIAIVVLVLIFVGIKIYKLEFDTSSERAKVAVDKIFNNISSLKNDEIDSGSGGYTLDVNITAGSNKFVTNIDGKYAYNLPGKKIDLIGNVNTLTLNEDLIDKPLNLELYLENSREYILLQNFTNTYVYTDVSNTKDMIDDIKTRFNNPDDILLFQIIDFLYNNNFSVITDNYGKYITNISQNDIDYQKIIQFMKSAIKSGLSDVTYEKQTINGSQNITSFRLSSSNKKRMVKGIVSFITSNESLLSNLSKLNGLSTDEYKKKLNNFIDSYDPDDSNEYVKIVTDGFKKTFISMSIPVTYKDNTYTINFIPSGSGYNIQVSKDNKTIMNLKTSKSTSKTSTVKTENYTYEGSVYINDIAYEYKVNLVLNKDVAVNPVSVVTRNSIEYKYMSDDQRKTIADNISSFSNLGLYFKDSYASYNQISTEIGDNTDNSVTTDNLEQ